MNWRDNLGVLPAHMRQGLIDYMDHGLPPGSFLESVLSNNLGEAACRADSTNKDALATWGQFMMWYMPRNAWGSPEIVKSWLNSTEDAI